VLVTVKNLYPLDAELKVFPYSFSNPSTKNSSPILNGAVVNPTIGVPKVTVTIPLLVSVTIVSPIATLVTETPFVLSTVINSGIFNPLGADIISILSIDCVDGLTFGCKYPEVLTSLVILSITTIVGLERNPLPPLTTSKLLSTP